MVTTQAPISPVQDALYKSPPGKPVLVDVPAMRFAMVDGTGNPNGNAAMEGAIQALYAVSYSAKFKLKKADPTLDYRVRPLEGLWWPEGGPLSIDEAMANKDSWHWTLMISQPQTVTEQLFAQVVEEARRKRELPALDLVRLATFHEGLSAQLLYLGPYAEERATIEYLHEWARSQGYRLRGRHHEIYLGDPRRSAPEKLKTLIRQPVE